MFAPLSTHPTQLVRMLFVRVWFVLAVLVLVACKTTESAGLRDYSGGVNVAIEASATNPAYVIAETVGAAGYGYAYLLEKADGRWRVMYDSYDAKAFAKPAGDFKEVPEGTEVLWTDGKEVVAYFGTQPLVFSKTDGSFVCPKAKNLPGHRACRSLLTESKSVFDGLNVNKDNQPFVLDIEEIKQAVADTNIVTIAKNLMARDK